MEKTFLYNAAHAVFIQVQNVCFLNIQGFGYVSGFTMGWNVIRVEDDVLKVPNCGLRSSIDRKMAIFA